MGETAPSSAPSGPLSLASPVRVIPGVGPKRAEAFDLLGVRSVGQLLIHLPHRHERLEAESGLEDLVPGTIVTVRGEISATRVVPIGKKPRFEAVLVDGAGRLDLVWFNAGWLRNKIHAGMRLRVHGKVKPFGKLTQIANPKWEAIPDTADEPSTNDARLRPIYPASERLSSEQIESAIQAVLPTVLPQLDDHLADPYRDERALPALNAAYRMIHTPDSDGEVTEAKRRLAYDELLLLQLGVAMKRAHLRRSLRAPALRWDDEIDAHIRARFPFELTDGQNHAVGELSTDLASDTPTNRLVQGDVGSGKTMIALYAMLMAVASGHQAALMAPTELLAEQHGASISRMLEGSDVKTALLTGSLSASERADIAAALADGSIDILIGTHAVLTESVSFKSLAVAIIDEQHRFGVHQRATLRTKGTAEEDDGGLTPHVLVMTATPIPRTIALSLFGDLDVSTIRGLPPGRTPITTRVVSHDDSDEVYGFVRERVESGDQAYVVVPAIDAAGDDVRDLRTVQARLEGGPLKDLRVAALHGRLKRATREHIMHRFRAGQIDVLIATTVIEVGVDVPNATVMVVEQAERFGLAQLHQLRGRVGRGQKRSVCVLIGDPQTPDGQARLGVMGETTDGFRIAERDLEIRGPGEVFGTRQAGLPPFRVADLMRDVELLRMARRDAAEWIDRSPLLEAPDEALIRRRLLKAHGKWLGLGDVG